MATPSGGIATRRRAASATVIGMAVEKPSVGSKVWSGSWTTVPGVRVAGTRPCAPAVYEPVYPNLTGIETDPSTPVPFAVSGAVNSDALTAIGL